MVGVPLIPGLVQMIPDHPVLSTLRSMYGALARDFIVYRVRHNSRFCLAKKPTEANFVREITSWGTSGPSPSDLLPIRFFVSPIGQVSGRDVAAQSYQKYKRSLDKQFEERRENNELRDHLRRKCGPAYSGHPIWNVFPLMVGE